MSELFLEQLLLRRAGTADVEVVAKSHGVGEPWVAELVKVCTAFGARPGELDYERIVFAFPLVKRNAVVVRVADLKDGALGFYLMILPSQAYRWLGGDPFFLADQLPPQWDLHGDVEPRRCDVEPAPYRTIADVQSILKTDNGPTLLGATQALLDGGKVVLRRDAPDEETCRNLWQLLPTSSRAEFWPSSFVFADGLPLNVVVTAHVGDEAYVEYCREEQVGDYPEGRYELRLQHAVESEDQAEMDRLFARRSPRETIRLGLLILILAVLLPVLGGLLGQLIP